VWAKYMFKHLKQKVLRMKYQHFYPTLPKLRGRVLEIGFGDGESLAYYSSNCEVFALEKSDKKLHAQKNRSVEYKNVKYIKGEAESLPFEDNFFDAVVISFVICSVNSMERVMSEIERVLKPYGKFIFLEHVKSNNKVIGKLQDIFAEPHSWIAKNCHPNRNPLSFINKASFCLSVKKEVPYILGSLVFAQAYKKEEIDCEQTSA